MIIRYTKGLDGPQVVYQLDTEHGVETALGYPLYPSAGSYMWNDLDVINGRLGAYATMVDEMSGRDFLRAVGAAPFNTGTPSSVTAAHGRIRSRFLTAWGFCLVVGEHYPPYAISGAVRVTTPESGPVTQNFYTLPSWVADAVAAGGVVASAECSSGTRILLVDGGYFRVSAPLASATDAWTLATSVAIPNIPEPADDTEYRLRGAELTFLIVDAIRAIGDEVLTIPYIEAEGGTDVDISRRTRVSVIGSDLMVPEVIEVVDTSGGGWDLIDTQLKTWRVTVSGGVATDSESKVDSLLNLTGEYSISNILLELGTDFTNVQPTFFWTGYKLAAETA